MARSFDKVGRDSAFCLQCVCALPRWVYTTAIVGTAAFGLLMLAVGPGGAALLFAMPATMILVVGRRRGAPGRAET